MTVRTYGQDTGFDYGWQSDLDLGDMILVQDHDTPLGHGQ